MVRGPLPRHPDADAHIRDFQAVLWTATAGRALPTEVSEWLRSRVVHRPLQELSTIQGARDWIRAWRTGRRAARATAARASSSPSTPVGPAVTDNTQEEEAGLHRRRTWEAPTRPRSRCASRRGVNLRPGRSLQGGRTTRTSTAGACSPSPAVISGDSDLEWPRFDLVMVQSPASDCRSAAV